MRRFALRSCLALALAGGLSAPLFAQAPKKADAILAEIKAVEMPSVDKVNRDDRAQVMEFIQKRQAAMSKRADLIGQLYKAEPTNPELKTLLPERWQALMSGGPAKAADLAEELKDIQANGKDEKIKADAAYFSAITVFSKAGRNGKPEDLVKAADAFAKAAPKDDRAAQLFASVASRMPDGSAEQKTLQKRILKEFPNSQAAQMLAGSLKQAESVGKPFDLEFTDAIKGTTVSTKSNLKGKVVVVDFWATWCGPCVAEMPNMKKLYAEYKDKGVEFVGVSLDQPKEQGGLDKLKEFVAKNEIAWPQYYQGNGWQSEFSAGWGINSIPAVFIVDAQGKLHSVDARGKLETLIPELLKKSKNDAGAGAGAGGN